VEWGALALLLKRLSELRQDMEATMASFSDIPPIVIASNVFPYLENRTDWNNLSLVNKDIHNAVTGHKQLEPPWPEGKLRDESIDSGATLRAPTFSPDGDFIAHGDWTGNLYLWNRATGLVAIWHGHDRAAAIDDDGSNDDDFVTVDKVIFSQNSNLLASVA
jgi:WD40 repeat protein